MPDTAPTPGARPPTTTAPTASTSRAGTARPPKPVPLAPRFDQIPADLRNEARWVTWRYVWIPGEGAKPGKWTKVPYNCRNVRARGKASTTNPSTWGTFPQADVRYHSGDYDGIGFVLGDGFVGVDIDGCRDPLTGDLTETAAAILAELRTYAEASPSGTGVHAIMRGTKPSGSVATLPDDCKLEMYDAGRYFTVTGHEL